MPSETIAPQQRLTEEERLRAEEDQARLHRISLFLKDRRRRRRSRLVTAATVTAGIFLLAASVGWHLRDRGYKATSVASDAPPAVTRPIAPPVAIQKAPSEIDATATPLPAAPSQEKAVPLPVTPSASHEQTPAAKPPAPARASSKAVKHAQAPIPPPKFLDRPLSSSETPATRPAAQPAPNTATRPAGTGGNASMRTAAPAPSAPPVDLRRNSGVESP